MNNHFRFQHPSVLSSPLHIVSFPTFLALDSAHCSPQKYVQDVLREQLSESVYQCLREEGGHIYVCGDVTMAGDVLKTVQQVIKQQGNMSLEDAGFFISKLRVRGGGSGGGAERSLRLL